MNSVPNPIPSVPARIDQPRDRPRDGPTNPIGMVKYWKFPRNHSMVCCQTLPCRSGSGIQSIECTSICPSSVLWTSCTAVSVRDSVAIPHPRSGGAGLSARCLASHDQGMLCTCQSPFRKISGRDSDRRGASRYRSGAFRPLALSDLTAADRHGACWGRGVAPEGVVAGGHAWIHGRVLHAGADPAFAYLRVRPVGHLDADRADLDLAAVEAGWRVQHQGANVCSDVKDDAARYGGSWDRFRHGAGLLTYSC